MAVRGFFVDGGRGVVGTEAINTRIAEIEAELAVMTATAGHGQPNSSGGGEAIDHVGHRAALLREWRDLKQMLPFAGGPWELKS